MVNLSSDTLKLKEDSENSIKLVGEDLKSLNIKGGSSLNLVESSENLTSVDATQLEGSLNANFSNSKLESLKATEQDDTIQVSIDKTKVDMELVGSFGEDTLY